MANFRVNGVEQQGGNLLFSPDATYDIGANGATRPRDVYASRNVLAPNVFVNTSKFASGSDGVVAITNAAATDFTRLQFGGTGATVPALEKQGSTLAAMTGDGSTTVVFRAAAIVTSIANVGSTSAAATMGNVGGVAGPVATAQSGWMRMQDSSGGAAYVPLFR